MSGDLKFTVQVRPLTIGLFRGKCFLCYGRFHVKTKEPSKTRNGVVCFDLEESELVDLASDTEIRPVDAEILIT